MYSQRNRRMLKHLGTLYGSGKLLDANGEASYGEVAYQIDGYFDTVTRSDNGRIEGGRKILGQAFRAGAARIALEDGQLVDIVLDDPDGDAVAEITVKGSFPEFGESNS